jgi:hypothetical protein
VRGVAVVPEVEEEDAEVPRQLPTGGLPVPRRAEESVEYDEGRAGPSKVAMEEAQVRRRRSWFR